MADGRDKTHLHDTPLGSGFRFAAELVAWSTGTWAAWLVHPVLGVAALAVMIGLPTVFTTRGDKKHTMIEVPGQVRMLIDGFQLAVAAIAPWFVLPGSVAAFCVLIVIAALFFGFRRFHWLCRGAPLDG